MTPHSPLPIVIPHVDLATENAALRAENATFRQRLTQAEAVIVELRGVVAELRKLIDSQQVLTPEQKWLFRRVGATINIEAGASSPSFCRTQLS